MLACQAIKYPMPDAESNFPRRKKGGASFASTSYDFEDEENTKRFPLSLSLLFAREIEKDVTKSFLQNEIYYYFYLLITLLLYNTVTLLLICNLLHVFDS